ncbi:MAG: hypothetical protein WBS20_05870, partial [Lysobacterales bacterium]
EFVFFSSGQFPQFTDNLVAYGIATQADGKVLFFGSFTDSPGGFVARLNHNGTPDLSFAENGILELLVGDDSDVFGMTLLNDGSLVVGGTFSSTESSLQQGYVAKITRQGELASTFADNGVQILERISGHTFSQIARAQDGGVYTAWNYAAGFNSVTGPLIKSDQAGQLDVNFGVDGVLERSSGLLAWDRGLDILEDGNIVTYRISSFAPLLFKYDEFGNSDADFNGDSIDTGPLRGGLMRIRADGVIFVGGTKADSPADAEVRLFGLKNNIPLLNPRFFQDGEIDMLFRSSFD